MRGCTPPDIKLDPVESQEAINQLVDLGYIDPPDKDQKKAVDETVRELRYNLALSYVDANRFGEAIPLLDELWEKWPEESRFGVQLFQCLISLERVKEARETLEKITERKTRYAKKARADLEKLAEELKDKKPEDLSQRERRRLRRTRARAVANPHAFAFLTGALLHAEGRHEEALKALALAEKAQTHNLPSVHQKAGENYLALKRWRQAEESFRKVLTIDPINPFAHLGLAKVHLAERRNLKAIDEALASVGQQFQNPTGHFLLGIALHRCGRVTEAVHSIETALSQNPVFPEAHRRLAYIYQKRLADWKKATEHRRLAKESRRRIREFKRLGVPRSPHDVPGESVSAPEAASEPRPSSVQRKPTAPLDRSIVIVSGLPRSGTSMMMQMLRAGGLPVMTDEKRKADASNPKGYLEFEQVKQLGKDNAWLGKAKGHAVKIIAQLLPRLPRGFDYRVIFMERDLDEVLDSQEKMLKRLGRKGGALPREKMARNFTRQLHVIQRILAQSTNVCMLRVNYTDAVRDPAAAAAEVNEFLEGKLDEKSMTRSVDPGLRHHKTEPAA